MSFERLKGFRDLYPEDAEPKFYVMQRAQETAKSFGFRHIEMPSLETLELYRLKSGEELVSQTFSFVDKGGREVTMIPEATPSVVRMLTARKDLPRPVKWFSMPRIWRYEEPQSGRLREHIQFNADIFGADTPEADAEIMGLAASILDSLGLSGMFNIHINDRQLMDLILKSLGTADTLAAFAVIDKFKKIEREEFSRQLTALGYSQDAINGIVKLMETRCDSTNLRKTVLEINPVSKELLDTVERVETTLNLYSSYSESKIFVDFSVVRGLSYYTGLVFEVFDLRGDFRSILGGGRYNNLSGLMSDQNVPAVGFGMGDVVIELLLKSKELWKVPHEPDSFYVCVASRDLMNTALSISSELRAEGFISSADISRRGLSGQLKSASTSGYRYAVILGMKEIETGTVTLRDLNTGTQQQIKRELLVQSVKKL